MESSAQKQKLPVLLLAHPENFTKVYPFEPHLANRQTTGATGFE